MNDPRILYLDQNHWIELAACIRNPKECHETRQVLELLVQEVSEGRLVVPLSFANIYETHKINDPERRLHLAWVQATLSQGVVFRSRNALLQAQVDEYLRTAFSLPGPHRSSRWFLSKLFFEAVADYTPTVFGRSIPEPILERMRSNPPYALFSFLTEVPEDVRRKGVERYSAGSRELIGRIQQRRELLEGEPISMRLRAYSARLLLDHLNVVFKQASSLGLPVATVEDLGSGRARAIMKQVPALDIEREVVTKIEHEDRVIDENDLRDVFALTTVLPYADVVIAEKALVNSSAGRQNWEKSTKLNYLPHWQHFSSRASKRVGDRVGRQQGDDRQATRRTSQRARFRSHLGESQGPVAPQAHQKILSPRHF